MTKIITNLLFALGLAVSSEGAIPDTTSGDFDADGLEDTIYYHYDNNPDDGPCYYLRLVRGCGEVQRFVIGVGFESMRISGLKPGVIETWQWKAGNTGFKIETVYQYDARYDDWLEIRETTKSPGEGATVYRRDIPTGISGREYPKPLRHKKFKR